MEQKERGSILLFTLFSLLLLSLLVYQILAPYRQMGGDVNATLTRDRGISYLYSAENILGKLLPRIDVNFYRQLNRIPPGSPIVLTFPVPEGTLKASLFSDNTCLNITLPAKPTRSDLLTLQTKLVSLAKLTGHHDIDATKIISLQQPSPFEGASTTQPYTLASNDPATAKAYEALRPLLCRHQKPGQYIDINAIDTQTLPALEVLLPTANGNNSLMNIYEHRGNNYWSSVKQFPAVTSIPSNIQDMLGIESQDFRLEFSYKTRDYDFSATSWLHMENGKLSLTRRRLITDGSL